MRRLWSNVLDGLGPQARRFKLLFVPADPERDTPEALQAYLQSFKGITAPTGSPAQIAAAAVQFDAACSRHDGENGQHSYDHSIKAYLIAGDQHLFATLDLDTQPAVRRNIPQGLRGAMRTLSGEDDAAKPAR